MQNSDEAGTGSNNYDSGTNEDNHNNGNDDNQVFGTTSPTPHSTESNNYEEPPQSIVAKIGLPQVAGWNNNIPPIGGKGARARDYTDEVYRIILKACIRYEIFIATEQAFPDANRQATVAHAFFNEACTDMDSNYQVTDRIASIVSDDLLSFLLMIILTCL